MERRKLVISFVILLASVVLMAVVARIWLNATGYDKNAANTQTVKSDPPANSRSVDEGTLEYLELGIPAEKTPDNTEKTEKEGVEEEKNEDLQEPEAGTTDGSAPEFQKLL